MKEEEEEEEEEEEIRWVGRCVAIEMIGTTIHEGRAQIYS